MESEGTKTGLVAFFDILGYQNLLERNEPEKIAEEVLPILTNIGDRVKQDLDLCHKSAILDIKEKNKKSEYNDIVQALEDRHKMIIERMRWLIFSDTVLLALPIEEGDQDIVNMSWFIFIMASSALQANLFRAGLPVRGAIDFGKFFIKDTCFAGRTIVNTYQLCSQLEIAACVFSENATIEFRRLELFDYWMDNIVSEYLIPMKSGERHLLTVRVYLFDNDSPDIHGEVMRAFWGNRKDISISARQKAKNTEQWLEYIEYRQKIKKEKESS